MFAPVPIRLKQLVPLKAPATLETWTRSPTKSDVDPVIGSWHLTTSFGGSIHIAILPCYPFSLSRVVSFPLTGNCLIVCLEFDRILEDLIGYLNLR